MTEIIIDNDLKIADNINMIKKLSKTTVSYFRAITLVSLLVLASSALWLTYRIDTLSKQTAEVAETEANQHSVPGWSTTLTSGKGGFEITLPDGWGPITNDATDDFMIISGSQQPDLAKGKKVAVNNVQGYGTDSSSVFLVSLANKDEISPARGESVPFGPQKEELPTGKKYTYQYNKDSLMGIGVLRLEGDRDYYYAFPVDDKKVLYVSYSVYGSDPRNLVETVDDIVRTINVH